MTDNPIDEAVVFKAADALCGEWNLHYPDAVRMATVVLTTAQLRCQEQQQGHPASEEVCPRCGAPCNISPDGYECTYAPPSMPVGVEGLPRYGFPNGDEPRPVPCADGYWTPWHLAQQPAAKVVVTRDDDGEIIRVTQGDRLIASTTHAGGKQPAAVDDEENRDAWRTLWLVLRQTGTVVVPLYDIASADWPKCQIERTEHKLTGAVRLSAILLAAQQQESNDA